MEVIAKEIDYCKLEINYTGDPSVVSEKRNEVVANLRSIQIPGFRKGKAPDSAIRLSLAKEISVHVAEYMKVQAYDDAVFETEIKPMFQPKFEDVKLDGNNFSCKMTLFKKPDFKLNDIKYNIPNPDINYDEEAEVQKSLEELRLKFGDVIPYDENDFVENGDEVSISYEAYIDGKSFDGSSSEGQVYVVGKNSLKEFDDNILGMSPGESREFNLIFPESYPEIGGNTALFKVILNMGTKKIPCSLDDNLSKQCGEETLEALKDKLIKISKAKAKEAILIKVRQQVTSRIVEEHDFQVPEFLTEMEAQHISIRNGINYFSLDDSEKDVLKKQAEKQVKLSLILDSIREQEPDSVLSDAEAQNGLAKRAQINGMDPIVFMTEAKKSGRLFGLMAGLKDEYTLQWLVDQAVLKE